MAVRIDKSKCTGCGICVEACPVGAITVDQVAKIAGDICVDCGSCVAECPNEALFMEGMKSMPPPPSRSYSSPPPPIPAMGGGETPRPPRLPAGNRSGFQRINGGGGILEMVFSLIGKVVGQGGGGGQGAEGRGRDRNCGGRGGGGGRRGRGKRRRG